MFQGEYFISERTKLQSSKKYSSSFPASALSGGTVVRSRHFHGSIVSFRGKKRFLTFFEGGISCLENNEAIELKKMIHIRIQHVH